MSYEKDTSAREPVLHLSLCPDNLYVHPVSGAVDSHVISCFTILRGGSDGNTEHHPLDSQRRLVKVKLLAVKRQTSVSGLLVQTLTRLIQQEDAYVHARQRHLHRLEQSIDLGTEGQIPIRRDELHERV